MKKNSIHIRKDEDLLTYVTEAYKKEKQKNNLKSPLVAHINKSSFVSTMKENDLINQLKINRPNYPDNLKAKAAGKRLYKLDVYNNIFGGNKGLELFPKEGENKKRIIEQIRLDSFNRKQLKHFKEQPPKKLFENNLFGMDKLSKQFRENSISKYINNTNERKHEVKTVKESAIDALFNRIDHSNKSGNFNSALQHKNKKIFNKEINELKSQLEQLNKQTIPVIEIQTANNLKENSVLFSKKFLRGEGWIHPPNEVDSNNKLKF
jgi:hypothetical protein